VDIERAARALVKEYRDIYPNAGWPALPEAIRLAEAALRGQMDEAAIKAVVDDQANDDGLWFIPVTITEDYLQRALRRLHAAIEGKSPQQCAIETLVRLGKTT
jgi:hypothetical protein